MRAQVKAGLSGIAAFAVLAAGCGDDDDSTAQPPTVLAAADCQELASAFVGDLQDYVDAFSDVTSDPTAGTPDDAAAVPDDLSRTAADVRARAEELGCEAAEMAPLIEENLADLDADTGLQTAVVSMFQSDPLAVFKSVEPETLAIDSSEALLRTLATVAPGSTLQLAAGTFELDVPLVLLRPVTIEGAGAGRTTIRSSVAGATAVIASDGDVRVSGVTLEHVGDQAASVIVVTAGGYDLDDLVVRGGAGQPDAGGGFGIELRPSDEETPHDGRRRIRDTTISDNDGGGILAGGAHAPTIRNVELAGRRSCGLCWIGSASGEIEDSVISGFDVGAEVSDEAAPTVSGTTIRDAGQIGIRLAGSSTATVEDNQIEGDQRVGIAIIDNAEPRIRGGEVAVAGEVGLIWSDQGAGSAQGITIRSARVGIQLLDNTGPSLGDLVIEGVGDAALLAAGESAGSLERIRCDGTPSGVVALVDDTTLAVGDDIECELVTQR